MSSDAREAAGDGKLHATKTSATNGAGGSSSSGSGGSSGSSGGSTHAFSINAAPFNPAESMLASTHVVRDIRDMMDYDVQALAMSAAGMMPCMMPQSYLPMPGAMALPMYTPPMVSRYSGTPVVRPPQPIASGMGVVGTSSGMLGMSSSSSAAASIAAAGGGAPAAGTKATTTRGALGGASGVSAAAGASSSSASRKEGSGAAAGGGSDKERFSVYAKPWSPQPDTNDDATPGRRTVDIDLPLWMPAVCCGKAGVAPVPLVSHEVNSNLFVHFVTIVPRTRTDIELKLYYYTCARCPLKTLYGRLSSRKPDVTLRNVAGDVPPICIAHLIDEVAGARVAALHVADADAFIYDVWLDKPNMSIQVVSALSGALWTCPMFHGYAVYTETDEARLFLLSYLNKFKATPKYAQSVYPMTLIEANEHV